jgi:hypothetical protein
LVPALYGLPLVGWLCKSAAAGLLAVVILLLYNSHEHRHLAQLASPQFSLHFYEFYYFFPVCVARLQKAPYSPIFPEVSYSPWAYFPPFFFYFHISSELVL